MPLNCLIWKDGDQYVAHAMSLDVVNSGKTPEEAKRAVREAVELFIATAKDMGTLNYILEECGYQIKGNEFMSAPCYIPGIR